MSRHPVLVAVLFATAAAGPAADPPLVKPATVPGGTTRVRFPLEGGENGALYRIKAIVPRPKAKGPKPKTDEEAGTPATVGLDTVLLDGGYVTAKTLAKWGYDTLAGQTVVLPELILIGQTSGGKGKPAEVHARAGNVKLNVVAKAYGSDTQISGADLTVGLDALLRVSPAQAQPWVVMTGGPALLANYPDKLAPKVAGEPVVVEDPAATPDSGRVPVQVTLKPGTYSLPCAGLHGRPAAAQVFGGPIVVFNLSGVAPPGVVITREMARLHDLKPDPEAKDLNVFGGFEKKGKMVVGRMRDLRLTVGAGAGFKPGKELAVKNPDVIIDLEQTAPTLFVGPAFLREHLQHPVLAVGPDGVPKLYGWAKPDEVADPHKKK